MIKAIDFTESGFYDKIFVLDENNKEYIYDKRANYCRLFHKYTSYESFLKSAGSSNSVFFEVNIKEPLPKTYLELIEVIRKYIPEMLL